MPATSFKLKKILHRPEVERVASLPASSAAGSFIRHLNIPAYGIQQGYVAVNSTSAVYEWDAWSETAHLLPASGIAGTFGAGCCGRATPLGPSGTATAGTTTTLTTNLTIPRDLRGFRIRITGGPGAGDERIISTNTIGANSVITVTSAFSATITASSTYQLMTPRLWVFVPAATPGLGYWDYATAAWTAGRSVTGVTFTGTDGVIAATAGAMGNTLDSSDSSGGAAATSSGTVVTLLGSSSTNAGRSYTTNAWAGAVMQVIGGTGAGQTRTIVSNTASTLTTNSAFSPALDTTSVWMLTKAFASSASNSAVFSSATTTVLTLTGVNWTASQWINSQIRIVAGTGAGQIRTISANTSTTLTVSSAWTTTPDATSIWVIEGNDDFLYLAGNNAVAMFRYSISGNSWVTATATSARAAAPGAGMSLCWVTRVNDSTWNTENTIKNGRYLYSFRGAAGAVLDQYDLALTTWASGLTYANNGETFTTGVCWEYDGRYIYAMQAATGRLLAFDFIVNAMDSVCTHAFPQGTAIVGDKIAGIAYQEGGTRILFIYQWLQTSSILTRVPIWFMP